MTFSNTPQLLKVVIGSALLFLTAGFGFVAWSRNSEAGWISLGVVAIFALLLGAVGRHLAHFPSAQTPKQLTHPATSPKNTRGASASAPAPRVL